MKNAFVVLNNSMVKTFLNVVNVFILKEEELVKNNHIIKGLLLQTIERQ